MSAEPGFVAETLAWCNERRVERGKKPLERLPKGRRHAAASCPCGQATGLYVWGSCFGESRYGVGAELVPKAVRDFVLAFDEGELPQYDEDAA